MGRLRVHARGPHLHDVIDDSIPLFEGAVAVGRLRWLARHREPKLRPVVLHRQRSHILGTPGWDVFALTTDHLTPDGTPRRHATGLALVGLSSLSWVVERAVWCPATAIVGVVWAAPGELLMACSEGVGEADGWAEATHLAHLDADWYWPKGAAALLA